MPQPVVPDTELQAAIDKAIETGVEWLKGEQSPNGSFGSVRSRGTTLHEMGTTALAGLALLAGGVERGEPAVDKVYQYLVREDERCGNSGDRLTYDTSVLLMFVTAYWRGQESEQAGHVKRPRRGAKNPCRFPKDEAEWVGGKDPRRWIHDLANFLVRKRKVATSTLGYPAERDDLSNTQYAFLGLQAARDCGAKVPDFVFVTAAKTMMERQEADGPKVPRAVQDEQAEGGFKLSDCGDRARGWSYVQDPFRTSGSMTTAGITILAICHDALTRPKCSTMYDGDMADELFRAVQDGFSWLDKNWSVASNPGTGPAAWHYYYLWGLKRACEFTGRDFVGLHDWYLEG